MSVSGRFPANEARFLPMKSARLLTIEWTFHTIGDHFISVSTDNPENDGLLRAYPNPASDVVFFDLKYQANTGRFELSNNLGQQVSAEQFSGKQFRFERKNLPAGIYHFQILTNNTQIATGKIVLK